MYPKLSRTYTVLHRTDGRQSPEFGLGSTQDLCVISLPVVAQGWFGRPLVAVVVDQRYLSVRRREGCD